MTNTVHFDSGELPHSGTVVNLLVWVYETGEPDEPQVLMMLNGPSDWFEDLDLHNPEYVDLPRDLASGLYVIRVQVNYELDVLDDPENMTLDVLGLSQVPVPRREELRDVDRIPKGVSA